MAARAKAAASQPGPAAPSASQPRPAAAEAARVAGKVTRAAGRGVGGFLRPFSRVGGIIWLEVTGVFFFLFVIVFAPIVWRTRPSHLQGPYDHNFLISAVIVLVFLYLSVSSFWRARRK